MSSSPAEEKLSRLLNRNGMGINFRKQVQIDGYILDFYCAKRRLAVEVDGLSHGDRKNRDRRRDAALAAQNIRTLRIPAADVMRDSRGVLKQVREALGARFYRQHTKSTETSKKLKLGKSVAVYVENDDQVRYLLTATERKLLGEADLRVQCVCRRIFTMAVENAGTITAQQCPLTEAEHAQVLKGDQWAAEEVKEARRSECRKDL